MDVRDIGLGGADDQRIAQHARFNDCCLISRDGDFGDILEFPPQDYSGIVVIKAPPNATIRQVLQLVEYFLGQIDALPPLKGRLTLVESGRLRQRPR